MANLCDLTGRRKTTTYSRSKDKKELLFCQVLKTSLEYYSVPLKYTAHD